MHKFENLSTDIIVYCKNIMKQIFVLSHNQLQKEQWHHVLAGQYSIKWLTDLKVNSRKDENPVPSLTILDADFLDQNISVYSQIKQSGQRILIIGNHWPEKKQILAIVSGASGYCEKSIAPAILYKAIESVIGGDIWIQRRLISPVIDQLVQANKTAAKTQSGMQAIQKKLEPLSKREIDVIKRVCEGQNNRTIAMSLNISERTVKYHLTSIFKKTDTPDRLHLAILFKESQL